MGSRKSKSALKIQKGVNPASNINEKALDQLKSSRTTQREPGVLLSAIRRGDRTALSKAITLVESALPEHELWASRLVNDSLNYSGKSLRIGITGVPGAGKSTFIETFGNYLIESGHRLAVLAIDPTSERSGGSILGDKTRMETLSGKEAAFIRPSPSGGSLGGVARKTRETMVLCEAAGYDIIIVETVGVGQSETTVQSMVDFFLVLMIPGAGDELQGMKRGIMEMADALVINKADGDNLEKADRAKSEYSNALHLYPIPPSGWPPQVLTCSSTENIGIKEVWNMICKYREFVTENSFFEKRRSEQASYWYHQSLQESLKNKFYNDPMVMEMIQKLEIQVRKGKIGSFDAAGEIIQLFFGRDQFSGK